MIIMRDEIKKPSECSEEEIENFCRLLLMQKNGRIGKSRFKEMIKRAELLAFHHEDGNLVGILALKRPGEKYRKNVFEKAGVPEEAEKYSLEIGWAFTVEKYRNMGIFSSLNEKLLAASGSRNIFATTRADNLPVQRILKTNGFKKTGRPYRGRGEYNLQLFTLLKGKPGKGM